MVEPGTAAIAVLSTIAGISGYGAMKINSKQADMIEAKVQERIKDTQELLKSTQSAKQAAESALRAQEEEVARLTAELKTIQSAKETLESEKTRLASSLQSATEGEQLFKSVPLPAFKQAIKDFKANDEVRTAQDDLTPVQQADVMKVFDKAESVSRFSLSRGTLQSLYQDLTKASGKQDGFMPRADFERIFTSALKAAEVSSSKGGSRKRTLKNRRQTIQNGRRTRRSKNSTDRTHSNTR